MAELATMNAEAGERAWIAVPHDGRAWTMVAGGSRWIATREGKARTAVVTRRPSQEAGTGRQNIISQDLPTSPVLTTATDTRTQMQQACTETPNPAGDHAATASIERVAEMSSQQLAETVPPASLALKCTLHRQSHTPPGRPKGSMVLHQPRKGNMVPHQPLEDSTRSTTTCSVQGVLVTLSAPHHAIEHRSPTMPPTATAIRTPQCKLRCPLVLHLHAHHQPFTKTVSHELKTHTDLETNMSNDVNPSEAAHTRTRIYPSVGSASAPTTTLLKPLQSTKSARTCVQSTDLVRCTPTKQPTRRTIPLRPC